MVNSNRLNVCSSGLPRAAFTMRATVSAVPDEAIAMSKPCSCTSRSKPARIERTYERHSSTARGVTMPAGKNRSVSRTAPSLKLRAAKRDALLADQHLGRAAADVDQHQPAVEHRHGLQHAEVDEARLLDAGDDLDLDVGLAPGAADEDVVVLGLAHRAGGDGADGAPWLSAIAFIRRSAPMPRSIASADSTFMSPPP